MKWKIIIISIVIIGTIARAVICYLFNMPHRNVQAQPVDFEMNAFYKYC